jgi:hypothetical protein
MSSRGRVINILGVICGILTLLIVAGSLSFILRGKPRSRVRRSYSAEVGSQKEEGEKFVEGEYERLEVKNIAGEIQIQGWNNDRVHVKYTKRGPTEQSTRNLKVIVETSGNTLHIKRDTLHRNVRDTCSISFEISVPEKITHIEAESVSGNIEITDVGSGISQNLKTVSGKIETSRTADLFARSTSGTVSFDFSGKKLSVKTVSGNIRGNISALKKGSDINLVSVSGSVQVEADKGLDADVTLSSVSGSITCDFPLSVILKKKNRIEGKIGNGNIRFNVSTTSGSIQIQKR